MAEEEASWDQSLEEWLISEAWSAEIWTLNMLEDAKNTKSSYSHWSNSSQHLNIQTTFLAFWQCCEVPDIRQLMAQIKSGPPGKLCCDMDSPLMNHNTDGYTEHENAIAFWAILSLDSPRYSCFLFWTQTSSFFLILQICTVFVGREILERPARTYAKLYKKMHSIQNHSVSRTI